MSERGTQAPLSNLSPANGDTHLMVLSHVTTSVGINEGDITSKMEGFLLFCAVSSCPMESRNYGQHNQTEDNIIPLNKKLEVFSRRQSQILHGT